MIDSLNGGGAERVLIHILRDLDRKRFAVSLFAVIKEGVYLKDVPKDVPIQAIFKSTADFRHPLSIALYRLYRRTTLELFKIFPSLLARMSGIRQSYDVGVSFCEGHNTPLLALKSAKFGKTLAWIHIDLRHHQAMIRKQALRRYARHFDKIHFVSEGAKAGFLELFPEFSRQTNLDVVLNPIDRQSILEAGKEPIAARQKPMVLAIGRLMHQKRFDKLLNVHKRLIDKGIEHEVWILGEGGDRKALEAQIDRLGIGKTCFLPGFVNPYPYLCAADVFVMTSDYEGLPVVICEAMVMAKPIVATAVTGPSELLENGKYGVLTENAEAAIETALQTMLEQPKLRESYSRKLRENRENFIFPTNVKDIEERLMAL
jgi:glycosyltransferase involved in cell wall biosynthesis